jgi:CheY-like chemotaxis protein
MQSSSFRCKLERPILLVDDEQGVLDAACEALETLECRVLATTDPLRALDIIRSDAPLSLLITDLFMPGMDGKRLLKAAQACRPGLPIMLITGVGSPEEIRKWRRKGHRLVAKPWLGNELIASVEQVLLSRTEGANAEAANE